MIFSNTENNIFLQVDILKRNLGLLIYEHLRHHYEEIFYSNLEMHELNHDKAISLVNNQDRSYSIWITGDNGTMELKETKITTI